MKKPFNCYGCGEPLNNYHRAIFIPFVRVWIMDGVKRDYCLQCAGFDYDGDKKPSPLVEGTVRKDLI